MVIDKGFVPVAEASARVLILGSLPSKRSLADGQYYALPQNAFWPIMGRLFGAGPELSYACRKQKLIMNHVALWDVLAASVRQGSLDASIVDATVQVNDFMSFFAAHPQIQRVCFNGRKAEQLFMCHVGRVWPELCATMDFLALPSTSPAHAAMRFEDKYSYWLQVETFARNQ